MKVVICLAFFDRIKFDGLASNEWLVYKHPSEKLVFGSQLIVGEGQAAVFVKSGQICSVFDSGTYTLSAQNLPLIQNLINAPFGGKTPFTAEIYYLNKTTKLDIAWGTNDPILLIDPKYNVRLHIRAFGQMGLKLKNCGLFIKELIGVMTPSEMVSFDALYQYFKGLVIQKIKVVIADIIINDKISALEIAPHINDISKKAEAEIDTEFEKFGLDAVNFFIQSINFPDEDFNAINSILEQRAEFDLMGDSRYATARSFDVYEGAANNSGGVAGAFMAGAVGIGAGAAIGTQMPNIIGNPTNAAQGNASAFILCGKCNSKNPEGTKFCPQCGESVVTKTAPSLKCPSCSAEVAQGSKFCNICGEKLGPNNCPDCNAEVPANSKFCPNCGKKF